MPPFDLVYLTARNATQKWLFEQRLHALSLGHIVRQVRVLADPEGAQIGSGGSTLCALAALLDDLGGPGSERKLRSRHVAIVHCGGLSQRVPQFASLGKAFAPGGFGEEVLLERILSSLARLTAQFPPGVTVACGDALYQAEAGDPCPTDAQAVAWVWPARLEQAANHGVYLWDSLTHRAVEVLQKPSPSLLRALGFEENAPLDTGVLYLRPAVVSALLAPHIQPERGPALRQLLRCSDRWRGLDLYRDVAAAFCAPPEPSGRFADLLAGLQRFGLTILSPATGRFEHFGTTQELLEAYCPAGEALLVNSLVHPEELRLGAGAVLQHCRLVSGAEVGPGSYALGLNGASIRVPDASLAYQLPVRAVGSRGEAVVALGTRENPKQAGSLLGEALPEWAAARGLSLRDVWARGEEPALWNARVFPLVRREAVGGALRWLTDPDAPRPEGSLASLREIHGAFDARRWWSYEQRLRVSVLARQLAQIAETQTDRALDELVEDVPRALAPAVLRELQALARKESGPLRAARLWRLCAGVARTKQVDSPHHMQAFAAIQRGLTRRGGVRPARRWAAPQGATLRATAPVRVDLAGGWTDTPPQACEVGGSVLNVALDLDGGHPILVRASLIPEPEVRFLTDDLGVELRCRSTSELLRFQDPGDPFALHKASLVEAGIVHPGLTDLRAHLAQMGGGLLLETAVRVPKGSGLGTSSILGAAVLAALRRLTGQDAGWESLFHAVLRLEQRMTTGGGWQDQVGGLLPGIKLTDTAPGMVQSPLVRPMHCSPEALQELEERMVLFYTGVPRLARNVLQRVVDRYLAREPLAMETLHRMKALAGELGLAIEAGDWDCLGRGIMESWELNKRLEPSATNADIERIFTAAAPHMLGAKLAGAGGGGFMFLLARSPGDAEALRDLLPCVQPTGQIMPACIAKEGLALSAGTD